MDCYEAIIRGLHQQLRPPAGIILRDPHWADDVWVIYGFRNRKMAFHLHVNHFGVLVIALGGSGNMLVEYERPDMLECLQQFIETC